MTYNKGVVNRVSMNGGDMQTKRQEYKGHDIRVTRFFDGLKNALFIDGKFTGEAGFFSVDAALAYGERMIDEA